MFRIGDKVLLRHYIDVLTGNNMVGTIRNIIVEVITGEKFYYLDVVAWLMFKEKDLQLLKSDRNIDIF